MFIYPPRTNVYTLPGQAEDATEFGPHSKAIRNAMEFLCTMLRDRCGQAPNHFWMSERHYMRLKNNKPLFHAITQIQGVQVHASRGLLGIHAAYLRPGVNAPDAFIGYPHEDLRSCPEFYCVVVPKHYRLFENSFIPVKEVA